MKFPHLFIGVLVALFCVIALTTAFDLQSYTDLGGASRYAKQATFAFIKASSKARFTWSSVGATLKAGASIQVTLPSHFEELTGQTRSCSLKVGAGAVITGTIGSAIVAAGADAVLVCTFANEVALPQDQTVQLDFDFCAKYRTDCFVGNSCRNSFVPQSLLPVAFLSNIFAGLTDVLTGGTQSWCSARHCCSTCAISFYEARVLREKYYVDNCFLDSDQLPPASGNNDGEYSSSIESFFDLSINVAAEASANGSSNFVAGASVALDVSFSTGTKLLKSVDRGFDEDIPAYVWANLAGYVGVDGEVECVVVATGMDNSVKKHWGSSTYPYKYSPRTKVRPINENDSTAGIIVMCALEADIEIGASIVLTIRKVTSPRPNPRCSVYGCEPTASSCCDSHYVTYRYGNSLADGVVCRSNTPRKCLNYYKDVSEVDAVNQREIRELAFSPTNVVVGNDYQGASLSFIASVNVAASSKVHAVFDLPGFRHPKYSTFTASTRFTGEFEFSSNDDKPIIVDGTTQVVADATIVLTADNILRFRFINVVFTAQSRITIFFPVLTATAQIPTTDTCSNDLSASGSTSDDINCCRKYRLQLRFNADADSQKFFYCGTCPILPGNGNNNGNNHRVCNPNNFRKEACCFPKKGHFDGTQLSKAQISECYKYRCSNPTSSLYEPQFCCTHGLYRHNEICCNKAYFCPNHCCGQTQKAEVDLITDDNIPEQPAYFNSEKCCELKPGVTTVVNNEDYVFGDSALPNLHHVCQCYATSKAEEWEAFAAEQCCIGDEPGEGGVHDEPFELAGKIRPPICACKELADAFARNPIPPLEEAPEGSVKRIEAIKKQQEILNDWVAFHPSLRPDVCCQYNIDSETFSLDFGGNFWCGCLDGAITVGVGYSADCCEYSYGENFFDYMLWCPINPPTPPDCGCDCDGSGCCQSQDVSISDITSADSTYITIGSQGGSNRRHRDDAADEQDEL